MKTIKVRACLYYPKAPASELWALPNKDFFSYALLAHKKYTDKKYKKLVIFTQYDEYTNECVAVHVVAPTGAAAASWLKFVKKLYGGVETVVYNAEFTADSVGPDCLYGSLIIPIAENRHVVDALGVDLRWGEMLLV